MSVIIESGDGNDIIDDGAGLNTAHLIGESGSDTVYTSSFANVFTHVDGGDGGEIIYSGAGSDQLDGGPGIDVVVYETASPVHASLQTGSGGRPGETDTYEEIEDLAGGSGDDVLIGDDSFNQLFGGGSNDQIFGYGAADEIDADQPSTGPGGQDFVMGGAGDDIISGDDGSDMLFGEAGNDTIIGGPDKGAGWYDLVNGGTGTDKCGLTPDDDAVACESLFPTPT